VNDKQAKSLRRMARALTAEAPWREEQWRGVPSKRYVDRTTGRGIAAQMQLHPECGRALYRRFKQGYRRLARKEAAAIQLLQKLGASRR
jgi:hypothetical protein